MVDLPAYEGIYAVTEDGKVWSYKRKRFLAQWAGAGGYLQVQLGTKIYLAHRVVAWTYLGDAPTDLHEINHKDGNKTNNHVTNLEWCTPSENMKHAWNTGLIVMTPAMVEQRRNQIAKVNARRKAAQEQS